MRTGVLKNVAQALALHSPQQRCEHTCRSVWPYRMVPARSGLNAYSQSCMSLSLEACSRIPRCSVHTANVLGVCKKSRGEEASSRRPRPHGATGTCQ